MIIRLVFSFSFTGMLLLSVCQSTTTSPTKAEQIVQVDPASLNELGNSLYRHGSGNPNNYKEALAAYQIAAEAGISNAQFYYARMHQYGHGCRQNFDLAWEFYQKSAKADDRRAWNNLGHMLNQGQGREPDRSASLKYYKRSSEMGMPMGSYNVALYHHFDSVKQDYNRAIKYYELAVEQYPRYGAAYNQMGRIYENGGNELEPDRSKAFSAFLLATNFGDEYGPSNLGRYYRDGLIIEPDLEVAEKLFIESARRGNNSAWNAAASLYWMTRYKQEDLQQALEYYLKAYEAGEKEFIYRIGYIYKEGAQELRDEAKAFTFLQESAELEQPMGIRSLGYCYAYGIGTEKNRSKAEALWLDCGGDESLMQWHQLGLLMAREDTDQPPNWLKAEAYLKKGTVTDYTGQAESWRSLGYLYRDAPEPMQDHRRALGCFQEAVELGDRPAQVALSHLKNTHPILETEVQ